MEEKQEKLCIQVLETLKKMMKLENDYGEKVRTVIQHVIRSLYYIWVGIRYSFVRLLLLSIKSFGEVKILQKR